MTRQQIEFEIELRKSRISKLEGRIDRASVYELDMLKYDLKRLEEMLKKLPNN